MTISKSWDPLDQKLSDEIFGAVTKREIKNILKSYTGWYDPLSELLQNALDATETRQMKGKDKDYIPQIWIEINLEQNQLCITDNGNGFNEKEFRSFLAPNVSFKDKKTRGNKGVGATCLAYGFNFLQIGTKTQDFSFIGHITNGREWVEDQTSTLTRPQIQESELIHKQFNEIDKGSTFTLRLLGNFIRPRTLNWVGANTVDQWEAILRIKTPLGGIYMGTSTPKIKCYLTLIDETGEITEKTIEECTYIYPHTIISTCKDLSEIIKIQKELTDKGRDASKLPSNLFKLNGLYNFWNTDELLNKEGYLKVTFDAKEKALIREHKILVYAFLCYSTSIWDEYNDNTLKLRKRGRILKGGIQLSTSSMPQGDLLSIPLTRSLWYQDITHVVVHFDSADPDLGRKGFQPELTSLSQKIASGIVVSFFGWKRLLQKETGAPPNIHETRNIHDWKQEQERHERDNPLVIKRKDVFLPLQEPSLTSTPLNEQDVIALFNQLLAGGVIRGIKIMATNQHEKYDGIFRLNLQEPIKNHLFDKDHNPLGILETRAKETYTSEPKILEYKYSFDALMNEIEKEEKTERHIDLVIAWTIGDSWMKRYEIVPLLHLGNLQHRYFHGGTHIIRNSMTGDRVFPAIILSELIDYINDPDEVQEYQRETYMNC